MKKLFVSAVCLLAAAAFVLNSSLAGYAAVRTETDHLRNYSTLSSADKTEDIVKAFGYGFRGQDGLKFLYDKGFKVRAAKAFNEGRAVVITPDMTAAQAEAAADEFLKKSGEFDVAKTSTSTANVLAHWLVYIPSVLLHEWYRQQSWWP